MFPSVQCAERAVQLEPQWAVARQTLGRAQLGLGELEMVTVVCKKVCFDGLCVCRLVRASRKQFTCYLPTKRLVYYYIISGIAMSANAIDCTMSYVIDES